MEHAANRASMSHQMSTSNRGRIIPAFRGHRGWPPGNAGVNGANAFEEPEDFIAGSHLDIGAFDADNTVDYGNPDGGRSDC